ncbi:site-specific tyrosine recombinase XerD [Rugosimonospora acidiphila]|uniref:Site-specific tyrosine recombinase XerD n=1 Tax=Rugosimonospora acidiphila TaxID=556531 RepID=A0ABP9RM10_9ACTN
MGSTPRAGAGLQPVANRHNRSLTPGDTPGTDLDTAAATRDAANRLAALTATWLTIKTSVHTQRAYRRDLRDWLTHCERAGIDPLAARIADVDAWIVTQRREPARGGRPASEATIARRVAAVSSWYTYLMANTADDPQPLATRNPAAAAGRPKIDPDYSATVGLTATEADRLLEAADADSATSSALIRLVFTAGLRVGSALGARVQDLGHDGGHRTLDIHVKGNRRDRIPLPPVVAEAVADMLTERGNPTTGPLFLTPTGRPIYHMYVYRLVQRLARQAALPAADRLTPHGLRHSAITAFLDQTHGNLRGAQRFAGHADPRTTGRYDRARRGLSDHGAYVLAARFGERTHPTPTEQ